MKEKIVDIEEALIMPRNVHHGSVMAAILPDLPFEIVRLGLFDRANKVFKDSVIKYKE